MPQKIPQIDVASAQPKKASHAFDGYQLQTLVAALVILDGSPLQDSEFVVALQNAVGARLMELHMHWKEHEKAALEAASKAAAEVPPPPPPPAE